MKVGILGAMDEEIMLLLEHYKDYESICFGGNTFYKIKQNGIIIASSRIGKVFSALSASIMILHFGCEGIIFTGVAGGVNPKYKIGDLVLGVELAQHDVDITAFGHPFGFLSGGKVLQKPMKNSIVLLKKSLKMKVLGCMRELLPQGINLFIILNAKSGLSILLKPML